VHLAANGGIFTREISSMGNPQRPDTNGTTTRALGIFVLSARQKTLRLRSETVLYSYDRLSRLSAGRGPSPGGGYCSIETHAYDGSGNLTDKTGSGPTAHVTVDQLTNGAVGLDYAKNRYYSNTLARFLSADPSVSNAPTDPGQWNKYAYVGGDPVNLYDPSGLYGSSPGSGDGGATCPAQYSYQECIALGYGTGNDPCYGSQTGQFLDPVGGAPCYVPPEERYTPPPPPTCSIELFTRSAGFPGDPGQHTYLDVIETSGSGGTILNDIFEAGPSNPHNPITHRKMSWGELEGFEAPIGATHQKGTKPSKNQEIGSVTGPDACADITMLFAYYYQYTDQWGVPYAPLPNGISTFNSNSFTYTLLSNIGLGATFTPTGWTPGWGQFVPGL
jgi:RHS repeat-associated protein